MKQCFFFLSFYSLAELILDRNVIERVSEAVGRLQNLKILSLADNLITTLPWFLNMRALALTVSQLFTRNYYQKIKNFITTQCATKINPQIRIKSQINHFY